MTRSGPSESGKGKGRCVGSLWVTIGHIRVTVGHLRVTVGHPWVTIGNLRVTMGHLTVVHNTGCCKTTGKLWQHITETLYGVFLLFLCSFDCQIWAIFHFGSLWL